MATHDNKGRTRRLDRFTNMPNYVLSSEAVRTLTPSAFKLMMYVAMRCYGAKDNGKIVFANRSGCLIRDPISGKWEEVSIGLPKSTTGDGLRELERHGLIVCTKFSTFDQKRRAKEYGLTWVKTESGPPTNEFMNFRSADEKTKRRPTHRPVKESIGRSAGSSALDEIMDEASQADPLACNDPDRPTHRPLCNHVHEGVGPVGLEPVVVPD